MNGFSGFNVRVTCASCGHDVAGRVEFDDEMHLADTPGFIWLGEGGIRCDECEPTPRTMGLVQTTLTCVRCKSEIEPGTGVLFVDDDLLPVDPEGLRIVVGGIHPVHVECPA